MGGISDLYLQSPPLTFLGTQTERSKTPLSFIGVPLDISSSFMPGSRFAPYRVRLASLSLETYSIRSGLDLSDVGVHDEGDVAIAYGDMNSSLRAIEVVAEDMLGGERLPVFVGGEHTLLYAIVKALVKVYGSKVCVIVFDAHADFRSEYLGVRLSHACTLRRVSEILPHNNIVLIGVRAFSSEELRDLRKLRIRYITSMDIVRYGVREIFRRLRDFLGVCPYIHVSIDMDVLDPSQAPAVSAPEPEGLTLTQLLDLLNLISVEGNVMSVDTSEYVPTIDINNVTAFVNAKIVIEVMTYLYRSRFSK